MSIPEAPYGRVKFGKVEKFQPITHILRIRNSSLKKAEARSTPASNRVKGHKILFDLNTYNKYSKQTFFKK